jgi:molybdenum cofactor guanylyltransferase
MGHDKALAIVQGEPILERVLRCLKEVSEHVMIIGEREAYRSFNVPVIADAVDGSGPLGGIVTALRNSPTEFMFVVGCDMPFLSSRLLQAMANEPRDADVLIPYLDDYNGFSGYQPLHALYSVRCVQPIMARLSRDELKIKLFLDDVDTRTLNSRWLRQYDPDLQSFTNVNTPDDLIRLSRQATDTNIEQTGR